MASGGECVYSLRMRSAPYGFVPGHAKSGASLSPSTPYSTSLTTTASVGLCESGRPSASTLREPRSWRHGGCGNYARRGQQRRQRSSTLATAGQSSGKHKRGRPVNGSGCCSDGFRADRSGRRCLSPRACQMGTLAVRLDDHAAARTGGAPGVLVADRGRLYWRVENRLGEVASSALVGEALDRAQRFLSELWAHPPRPPHLIHGDLTPDNILVDHGTLVPIDFQDLVWGLDIQDLAIVWSALAPFRRAGSPSRPVPCGYATVRPWPELDPETLAALIAAC